MNRTVVDETDYSSSTDVLSVTVVQYSTVEYRSNRSRTDGEIAKNESSGPVDGHFIRTVQYMFECS